MDKFPEYYTHYLVWFYLFAYVIILSYRGEFQLLYLFTVTITGDRAKIKTYAEHLRLLEF
jgi:hypothetical protein